MTDQSGSFVDEPATDPALRRTLETAGLTATGRFVAKPGWANRVWIGDDFVVRLSDGRYGDSFGHEANVISLLSGTDVPHARLLGRGEGPDGPWYICERLPGRSLHDAWQTADVPTRQSIIESLGSALRALHRIPITTRLLPPWLADALAGKPRISYHPPVVNAALHSVENARRHPDHDAPFLAEITAWIEQRQPLFADDEPVIVHGDLHGSNVVVDGGRVTGLVDFAESLTQPADVELDTILRWCARSREYPPVPHEQGLDEATLTAVPRWLRNVYPELFGRDRLHDRLLFYDMQRELALYAHHPAPEGRAVARDQIVRVLSGHNHLDNLAW